MSTVNRVSTTDLVRFLLARVDDDDDLLKAEGRRRAAGAVAADRGLRSLDRLRAETNAKREVIASAQQLLVLRDQPAEKPVRDNAVAILRALAQTYAGHPSFRSEWG